MRQWKSTTTTWIKSLGYAYAEKLCKNNSSALGLLYRKCIWILWQSWWSPHYRILSLKQLSGCFSVCLDDTLVKQIELIEYSSVALHLQFWLKYTLLFLCKAVHPLTFLIQVPKFSFYSLLILRIPLARFHSNFIQCKKNMFQVSKFCI